MKDLFSDNSQLYQQARPDYSAAILEAVLKYVPERQLAWDCGAGSGQFTQWLAPYFHQVLATDLSAAQLAQAQALANVAYRAAPAEQSGLPDHSADLITVAQAIHWFNFDDFYREVRRVLKPSGCLAVIGYGLITAEDLELNRLIQSLYADTLQGYWDAERRYVDELYKTIPFPFLEQAVPELTLNYSWSAELLLNYFNTWSGLKHYVKQQGLDPLETIDAYLKQQNAAQYAVKFPVLLRVGTVN